MMKYSDFNLSPEVLQAVEKMGFTEMTEIQEKAIPLMLEGRELIAKAPTGTGKTCAFGIPIVEKIDPAVPFPQAVILAVRFGAVRVETLRRGRPYVVVGILILAAILTPPDVVSQLLLAVPTWILFEIGLLIAARQQKRREAAAAAELDDAVLDVYRQDNES